MPRRDPTAISILLEGVRPVRVPLEDADDLVLDERHRVVVARVVHARHPSVAGRDDAQRRVARRTVGLEQAAGRDPASLGRVRWRQSLTAGIALDDPPALGLGQDEERVIAGTDSRKMGPGQSDRQRSNGNVLPLTLQPQTRPPSPGSRGRCSAQSSDPRPLRRQRHRLPRLHWPRPSSFQLSRPQPTRPPDLSAARPHRRFARRAGGRPAGGVSCFSSRPAPTDAGSAASMAAREALRSTGRRERTGTVERRESRAWTPSCSARSR